MTNWERIVNANRCHFSIDSNQIKSFDLVQFTRPMSMPYNRPQAEMPRFSTFHSGNGCPSNCAMLCPSSNDCESTDCAHVFFAFVYVARLSLALWIDKGFSGLQTARARPRSTGEKKMGTHIAQWGWNLINATETKLTEQPNLITKQKPIVEYMDRFVFSMPYNYLRSGCRRWQCNVFER